VSNGYISEKPLHELIPLISAANIDLKGSKEFYRKVCKVPDYEYIKRTIVTLKKAGVHVEVTNLLIPGANDSEQEIETLAKWLSENVGRDTPLHFSAFHPDFKMLSKESTPAKTLLKARELARKYLDYVYIGNVGGVENDTRCPKCGVVVIERKSYEGVSLLKDGKCQACGHTIAGRFSRRT
jgi:pyruvate formate lyase activating enzyme